METHKEKIINKIYWWGDNTCYETEENGIINQLNYGDVIKCWGTFNRILGRISDHILDQMKDEVGVNE